MFIKQISVFIENRNGAILELTSALKDAEINIRALSIADTTDFGVVRLIVDKTGEALAALHEKGLTAKEGDVIGVSVSDRPGCFHQAIAALSEADIPIEYAYAFVSPMGLGANVILRCKKQEQAVKALTDRGLRLLTQEEVNV